jgi:hypothetical protein
MKTLTAVGGLLGLGAAGYFIYQGQPDQLDASMAKTILADTLTSPSTAHYVSFESIDRKKAWRFERVVVDSQNQFGAVVRNSLCLVWHIEGDQIRWNKSDGVQPECPSLPDREYVHAIETLNGWPQ